MRTGSFMPIVHGMFLFGGLGYMMEFSHLGEFIVRGGGLRRGGAGSRRALLPEARSARAVAAG